MTVGSGRRRVAPSMQAAAVSFLGAVGIVVLLLTDWPQQADPLLLVGATAFVLVGALVLARAAGNRIGWILSLIGLSLVGAGIAGFLDDQGYLAGSAIGGALWFSWFALTGFLLLWFPDGRPPSRRWRPLEWTGYFSALTALSYVVAEELCVAEGDPCRQWAPNPLGIPGVPNPEYGPYGGLNLAVIGIFIVASIVSLVLRYRRARGLERLQMKWFLFAAFLFVAVILVGDLLDGSEVPDWVGNTIFGLGVAALPISIGLAVLRYRLYEIERIISRTVSYGMVIAALAGVYFGGITLLSQVLPVDSDLAVAASTLAVAGLFNPLRRRLQRLVDRRFNRSRYDAQRVIDAFSSSLRRRVDPIHMEEDLAGVVAQTLQPARVGIWVRR